MGNVIVSNITRTPVSNGNNWGSVAGTPATLIFSDDFASGDLSKTENGFIWGTPKSTSASTFNPKSGSHSLLFDFGFQAAAEQRFQLGAGYSELTLEWDQYFPDGTEGYGGLIYDNYNSDGSSSNDKFLRLWGTDYASPEKVGASTTIGDGAFRRQYAEWNDGGGMGWQGFDTTTDAFLSTAERGTWVKFKTYYKMASAANNDGVVRFYKNDVLLYERTTVDNYSAGSSHVWTDGYLLGSRNGGLPDGPDRMYILIDNFKVWDGEA